MPNFQGSSVHLHEPRCASCRPCKKHGVNLCLNSLFAALTPKETDTPAEKEEIDTVHSHGFSSTQLPKVTSSFHFHRLNRNCFTGPPVSSGVITSCFNYQLQQMTEPMYKKTTNIRPVLFGILYLLQPGYNCMDLCLPHVVVTEQAVSNSSDGLSSFCFFFPCASQWFLKKQN